MNMYPHPGSAPRAILGEGNTHLPCLKIASSHFPPCDLNLTPIFGCLIFDFRAAIINHLDCRPPLSKE